jgi:hypothetical protein
MLNPAEIDVFRADVAKYPGQSLYDICNLADDPDEPRLKTYLMKTACEVLLRVKPLEAGRRIVELATLNVPDSWFHPICEAISFIEAEDAGTLIESLENGDLT